MRGASAAPFYWRNRDKTRRKQIDSPEAAATGTDGAAVVIGRGVVTTDVSDVDIQRAGFGVL